MNIPGLEGHSNILMLKGAKIAGSSIARGLRRVCAEENIDFLLLKEVKEDTRNSVIILPPDKVHIFRKQLKDVWENSFKFCVTRNPITKAISGYNYHPACRGRSIQESFQYAESAGKDIYELDWKNEKPQKLGDKYSLYNHLNAKQHEYLYEQIEGEYIPFYDFLIRFENINEGIKEFNNLTGLNLKISHENKGPKKKKDISESDLNFIKEHFDKDFNLFNYSKEYPI